MSIMADSGQEFSGRSVDEAIAEGLAKLGIRSDQAEIEVLSRGSRGIFGLGSEPARVRINRRSQPATAQPSNQGQVATPAPAQPSPATSTVQTTTPASNETAPLTEAADPPQPARQPVEEQRSSRTNLLDDEDEEYEQSAESVHAAVVS